MAELAHTNIRVLDEARSVDFYRQAFGLAVADRLPFDDFALVFLRSPGTTFELELTINHGRTEPYSHGAGYGHLAVSVADIEAEHDRLTGLGLNPAPVKELYSGGKLAVRFFFVEDPDGYKVEVVQRQGRYT
ncbi:MAG TPA: VOC family protein [Thermohalobaculum sp.]|nr:VOC family protein [Thermohalobaculum sp.]